MNNNLTVPAHRPTSIDHQSQRGAVLVIAMLLLLVMTLLGVSGVENSLLEERMSGNFHDSYTAMQSAETALRVAEKWLAKEITAETVQFVPSKGDASYNTTKDWFGPNSSHQGLYSTQAAPGISTPCQGKTPKECTFTATNKDDWCSAPCAKLPKGYMALGVGELPAINKDQIDEQPRFIIEYLGRGLGASPSIVMGGASAGADTRMYAFRITAIGWGREATTLYVLQSHFQLQL